MMVESRYSYAIVVCTYKRHSSLSRLLHSITTQSRHPERVVIVDASDESFDMGQLPAQYSSIEWTYTLVSHADRGLTRQRNIGISMCTEDVIIFVDDDVVLDMHFVDTLAEGYSVHPDAAGIGGYVLDDTVWSQGGSKQSRISHHCFDGWCQKEEWRIIARKLLGLTPPEQPCIMPPEGHGRPIGSFPPSGKIYPAEFFMGCAMSFRRVIFSNIRFSHFFEGYGLYEDLHFCLQARKHGDLFVHTGAVLHHYHEPGGRPAALKYGWMVSRNGWYVWRERWPAPPPTAILRWWSIALLLLTIRICNAVIGTDRITALYESMGRLSGMFSILFDPPPHGQEAAQ